MSLLDQRVLITGGGTGIGQGVAWAFAAAGCRVVIGGRRSSKLQETVNAAPPGSWIREHSVDVTDRSSVKELVEWAIEQMGGVDVLVHAAGVNVKQRSMLEMSPEQWDQVMAVNATGAYNCMWAVLPQMRERHAGLIVNITSIAGKRAADLGGIAYCASKFAATGLGTAVGLEEARRGIRVTNVYPGEVDTPLLEQRPQPVSEERRKTMLRPEDVAKMVLAIAELPPHVHIPEMVIKPTVQAYA
jgi:NADP-dependent 3-hydroxy acid dehydrogenase YdfG